MTSTAFTPYPTAPAIGSLVTVPANGVSLCSCGCTFHQGMVGIVQHVQRDVKSGRVLWVGCRWYDADWRCVGTSGVGIRHVAPWFSQH